MGSPAGGGRSHDCPSITEAGRRPGSVVTGTASAYRGTGGGDCQPISSNALPLVSGTHLRMKGIESTAKTV